MGFRIFESCRIYRIEEHILDRNKNNIEICDLRYLLNRTSLRNGGDMRYNKPIGDTLLGTRGGFRGGVDRGAHPCWPWSTGVQGGCKN